MTVKISHSNAKICDFCESPRPPSPPSYYMPFKILALEEEEAAVWGPQLSLVRRGMQPEKTVTASMTATVSTMTPV